jgi:hypothetical protein
MLDYLYDLFYSSNVKSSAFLSICMLNMPIHLGITCEQQETKRQGDYNGVGAVEGMGRSCTSCLDLISCFKSDISRKENVYAVR